MPYHNEIPQMADGDASRLVSELLKDELRLAGPGAGTMYERLKVDGQILSLLHRAAQLGHSRGFDDGYMQAHDDLAQLSNAEVIDTTAVES